MIDSQAPRCKHIIKSLQKHNIRHGSVLLLGYDSVPLTYLLEKSGFKVKSCCHSNLKDKEQASKVTMNSSATAYDIIVLDDLLPHTANIYAAVKTARQQLSKGGILILQPLMQPEEQRG